MKILLDQIEEISMGSSDKPNDSLCIKLQGNFNIMIETPYVPCLSINNNIDGTYLILED